MEFNARAIHYIDYTGVNVLLLSWKHAWSHIIVFSKPTESYLALVARLNWLSQIARPTTAPCAAALFWEAL